MRRLTVPLTLAALAVGATPALADDPPTLSVQGQGSVELAPDVGTFDAQVTRTAATSAKARTETNHRLQAIVKSLTALGVTRSDITTTAVELTRERYRLPHSKALRVRYTAAGAFGVRVQGTDLVGQALDAAANAGATGVDGPEFDFSDALSTQGRLTAEQDALTDARSRADAAAASQGETVTGVKAIDLDPGSDAVSSQDSSSSAGVSAAAAPEPAKVAAPTPVLPGRQEFTSTVDVVYYIQPAG